MVVLSRRQVSHLLQERRQAMADTRFRPENYHEIHRVLGVRFAPDLTRVVSKQRANVASAYLKRLQRDVEKSKGGFYNQLQALPLQITRMKIHTEDTRTFRSVVVPKMKMPPLQEDDSQRAVWPKTYSPKSVSPGEDLPPLVLPRGSNFVAHKSFSPHTNTHIHVLYKQGPGSMTSRKGASSVASTSPSVQGTSHSSSVPDPKSRRPSLQHQGPPTKPSPREEARPKVIEDSQSESGSTSSVEDSPQPYSYFKMAKDQVPLPHIKKYLFVNLMSRNEPHKSRQEPQQEKDRDHPRQSFPASRVISRKGSNGIPPKGATALAAGGMNAFTAMYKFVLPSNLAASYTSVPVERPKALVMGSKSRHPLPSISPAKNAAGNSLAVTSVRPSLILHAAA